MVEDSSGVLSTGEYGFPLAPLDPGARVEAGHPLRCLQEADHQGCGFHLPLGEATPRWGARCFACSRCECEGRQVCAWRGLIPKFQPARAGEWQGPGCGVSSKHAQQQRSARGKSKRRCVHKPLFARSAD